jgi:hypothetical protein
VASKNGIVFADWASDPWYIELVHMAMIQGALKWKLVQKFLRICVMLRSSEDDAHSESKALFTEDIA